MAIENDDDREKAAEITGYIAIPCYIKRKGRDKTVPL